MEEPLKISVVDLTDNESGPSDSNAPGNPVVCKFILIMVSGELCFVLGSYDQFAYHANLVDRFCAERGIESGWARKPDLVEVYQKDVRIGGGGWMKIERVGAAIEIYGGSTAYGRFDSEAVEMIVENHAYFAASEVLIRG